MSSTAIQPNHSARPETAVRPEASASPGDRLEFGELALELLRLRALLEKPRPGRRALLAPFEVRSRVVHYLFQRTQQGATMTDVATELGVGLSQLSRWRKQQREALEAGKAELSRAIRYSTPGCASFLNVSVDTSDAHDEVTRPASTQEAGEPESSIQQSEVSCPPVLPMGSGLQSPSLNVITKAPLSPAGLTLVTPTGYRVEGLSLDAVCTLLGRLAC